MASAAINDASFTSPVANADYQASLDSVTGGLLSRAYEGMSGFNLFLSLLLILIAYDQVKYVWNKGSIVGPAWKTPFFGPFLSSIYPNLDEYKAKWASGELSCVSVFHKFVVIASSRDMARKVFNSPSFVKPCVVDAAHKLLRPTNWVFLDGKAHVDYRKGLNGLFTRQALEIYLPGQEEVYDKYFAKFIEISQVKNAGKPIPYMPIFRELMCAVSCRTFVGHYMSDDAIKKIADDYFNITAALELVNFPIMLPFTRAWYGKKAADMVLNEFAKCSAKSKARMAAGGTVTCIMDGWVQSMQESERYRQRVAKGGPAPVEKPAILLREFSDLEVSMTVFTFLFASQDATSSASTWLFQLMADRPEILDRVREENLAIRNGDKNVRFTIDILENMPYTRAVVKETLRYRPPVIMVPYVVKKDFPVTDSYTVPKGSMVVPSVWPALHDPEAYPEPESFDPERWITGDADKATKNWLVFGTGPHYCLGQTYAVLNLIAMIGKASMHLNWKHHATPLSEDIKVFATIFPQVKKISENPVKERIIVGIHQFSPSVLLFLISPSLLHPPSPLSFPIETNTGANAKKDLREPEELEESGRIPGAHLLPWNSNPNALHLSPEEFFMRFGFVKPNTTPEERWERRSKLYKGIVEGYSDSDCDNPEKRHGVYTALENLGELDKEDKDVEIKEVVFYCRSGVRSYKAAHLANLDVMWAPNVQSGDFKGGFLEWVARGGKAEKVNIRRTYMGTNKDGEQIIGTRAYKPRKVSKYPDEQIRKRKSNYPKRKEHEGKTMFRIPLLVSPRK
ncbi:RNA polymerase C-22 sterol desaturase [Pseudocyphellaria aurata]|nr:RNA polymerase C-22 sterol desaturase [Pseudocyphellaria aurata]